MAFDPSIGKATQWRKGQPSPNPGGRPKARLLSEALRSRLAEVKPDDPLGRTFAEIVAANLVEIASSEGPGAVHAAAEIADRIEGRARQQIEVALQLGRLLHHIFRGLLSVHSRYNLQIRRVALCDPLHRRLRRFCCLHRRSDCYRVERSSSRTGLSPAVVQRLSRRTVRRSSGL